MNTSTSILANKPERPRRLATVLFILIVLSAIGDDAAVAGAPSAPEATRAPSLIWPTADKSSALALPTETSVLPMRGQISMASGSIEISIQSMPLAEASNQLAAATHATLEGADVLRRASKRVTLHWQGSGSDAWQQLLAGDANYAAICRAQACNVRVLGLLTSSRPESPVARITTRAAPPQPDPPGLFPSDG